MITIKSSLLPTVRTDLDKRTLQNVEVLESVGFQFSDKVKARKVKQKGRVSPAKSLIIKGRGPEGERLEFHRKEISLPGAGSTYLKTPYGKVAVSELVKKARGEKVSPISYTSEKAGVHYGVPVKSYRSSSGRKRLKILRAKQREVGYEGLSKSEKLELAKLRSDL